MPIFKNEKGILSQLNAVAFNKEKELQLLIEQNLIEVLDLHFLASEYPTTAGGRIDTLAVDDSGCPVIIEYKLSKNENVINQALSYLKWLKAQKVEFFEMLVIKKLGNKFSEKVRKNWTNPIVICIAETYNKFDLDTVEVIPIHIELFKYRYYENGILSLEPLNNIKTIQIKDTVKVKKSEPDISDKIKKLLSVGQLPFQSIANEIRSRIMLLDENIEERPTSYYIGYRLSKNFAEIHIGKTQVSVYLRPLEYEDPLNKVEKIPDSYKWTINRKMYVNTAEDIDYVMQFIEQSYKDVL
jgi:predicted transport protein